MTQGRLLCAAAGIVGSYVLCKQLDCSQRSCVPACAMLCMRALPCMHAMPCHAMPCHAMRACDMCHACDMHLPCCACVACQMHGTCHVMPCMHVTCM
eukprot:362520-Chlamydomonas_euryale.AAC.6